MTKKEKIEETEKIARQEKRAARRQKQRDANVGRAKKMRAARLLNPILTEPSEPPLLNIGCSGWFYWHWRGTVYPENMPTKKWFPHYSTALKTVELNAPFYSWPTLAGVAAWKRQIGRKHFIYTIKVCELITHIKKFTGTKNLIKDFGYIADLLGHNMGCFLYQFPPSFYYTRARLRSIVAQVDPERRNVVEFRHASWWNQDVYDVFTKAGIIFCSCSGPRLPDVLIKTSEEVYIRFHGKTQWYRHNYTREELAEWADRIRQNGAKRIWAYFNNDYNGFAVKNAKSFLKLLKNQSV